MLVRECSPQHLKTLLNQIVSFFKIDFPLPFVSLFVLYFKQYLLPVTSILTCLLVIVAVCLTQLDQLEQIQQEGNLRCFNISNSSRVKNSYTSNKQKTRNIVPYWTPESGDQISQIQSCICDIWFCSPRHWAEYC